MKKSILPVLIPLLLVSGCTIPGTNIDIPFIPNLFNGDTVTYENDILVINSLEAVPSTVAPGQTLRLLAYVENKGNKRITEAEIMLFDYCKGIFQEPRRDHSGPSFEIPAKGTILRTWTLQAEDLKLLSTCSLKVSVSYPYSTSGLATIHFINEDERNRQLQEGRFTPKQSYKVAGEGPIKAYFNVEDEQPISDFPENTFILSLQIRNEGSGFLKGENKITKDKINIDWNGLTPDYGPDCAFEGNTVKEDIILINKESPKLTCKIKSLDHVVREETRTITIKVGLETKKYEYEFTRESKVTVEPKLLG